ncbi:amidohydrolase family protein [Streptomyces sp. 3N207]|uniref:amidohydrolase family protein n=1 Tax=Streptomyces sp. 3N207 TaxID=3457417 RepID=UPI003FD14716
MCTTSTTGSLRVGGFGDLAVLDRDIFDRPPEEIAEAGCWRSMWAGNGCMPPADA